MFLFDCRLLACQQLLCCCAPPGTFSYFSYGVPRKDLLLGGSCFTISSYHPRSTRWLVFFFFSFSPAAARSSSCSFALVPCLYKMLLAGSHDRKTDPFAHSSSNSLLFLLFLLLARWLSSSECQRPLHHDAKLVEDFEWCQKSGDFYPAPLAVRFLLIFHLSILQHSTRSPTSISTFFRRFFSSLCGTAAPARTILVLELMSLHSLSDDSFLHFLTLQLDSRRASFSPFVRFSFPYRRLLFNRVRYSLPMSSIFLGYLLRS